MTSGVSKGYMRNCSGGTVGGSPLTPTRTESGGARGRPRRPVPERGLGRQSRAADRGRRPPRRRRGGVALAHGVAGGRGRPAGRGVRYAPRAQGQLAPPPGGDGGPARPGAGWGWGGGGGGGGGGGEPV